MPAEGDEAKGNRNVGRQVYKQINNASFFFFSIPLSYKGLVFGSFKNTEIAVYQDYFTKS